MFKSFFKQRIYRIHFWEIEFILANPHIGRFKQFIGWVVGRCLCNHLEADQAMKLALIVNVKTPRRTGMKFVRGKGFVLVFYTNQSKCFALLSQKIAGVKSILWNRLIFTV